MTETPNDPVNAPEPESANGSTPHTEPTVQQPAAQGQTASDQAAAEQATPEQPTAEQPASEQPAPAQSAAEPPSPPADQPAPQQPITWAAPLTTAPQPPLSEQTPAQQPTTQQPPTPTAQQPTVQQPTAQQPTAAYPTADYGNGAFGQPTGQPTQQHYGAYAGQQQYAGQPPYAAHPTQPVPGSTTATDKQTKKRGLGLVVAALAVGALIGGASGAGVMGVFQASQNGAAKPSQSTGAQNITVNNAADATPVTAVAAKASPSVVTISVTGSQAAGSGSGVVLSADGYVLTNTHVVTLDGEIADPKIQVQDNDGKLYSAKVIGTDPIVDLAVIKLDNASGMTPATFADSSKLNVGDRAVAIGAPLGLAGTVTDGIVSALNRSIQIASSAAPKSGDNSDQGGDGNLWNFDLPGQGQSDQGSQNATISLPVIQTDAAINPGNSGGALLNSKGEVIGINVAIANASGSSGDSGAQSGSIGVGFAIPSDLASRVADELKQNGKATHGLLGATVKDASADKSSTTVGALIDSVSKGGAAEDAGLKSGDIVTNFNGIPITNPTDLTAQVRALAAGAESKLTYVRDGKPYTVDVKLGELSQ